MNHAFLGPVPPVVRPVDDPGSGLSLAEVLADWERRRPGERFPYNFVVTRDGSAVQVCPQSCAHPVDNSFGGFSLDR